MAFSLFSFLFEDTTCFEIIKALYGLTDNELEILACIHNIQNADIKAIQEIIPKDYSTLTRSLHKLVTTGLVKKAKVTLPRGGYKYQYTALSIEEIKEKVHSLLDEIYVRMHGAISKFTEEKCRELYESVMVKYKQK